MWVPGGTTRPKWAARRPWIPMWGRSRAPGCRTRSGRRRATHEGGGPQLPTRGIGILVRSTVGRTQACPPRGRGVGVPPPPAFRSDVTGTHTCNSYRLAFGGKPPAGAKTMHVGPGVDDGLRPIRG